ncbi:sugar ABC transporter ATP-binding protein [Rhodobacter calidifons]|uniref:Sugar ABC transporter ATP-binding protein n=1 Tax=Rhodobacter calidifons TaxID=2715277 RepID=A0ABX0G5H4_9RHOB|nr:sugar ABC transporter ATP-binding protein [Rhodobacter calidifons]NHB76036.1 sugar ABC transporter ATP-binding protein [Rhodobacter calidifons]
MTQPVLELKGLSKSFAATQALKDMSLAVMPGEVHAIVGENGAGKSTLIKIMTGVHQPDTGTITVDGQPVTLRSTQAAQDAGIAAIYQEPMVFPDLNVAENIFISNRAKGRIMRWSEIYAEAEALIAPLGVKLDVSRAASGLTLAEQQTVEIARALSLKVKVLIMDEPTASLSAHEVARLLDIARALKAQGVAVIYISHRLDEIFRIADRVTVIRDGQHISTKPIAEVTEDGLVKDMVGRALESFAVKNAATPHGETLLSVNNLTCTGIFQGITFDLHKGEVLCLAGLVGARRTDVALSLFGIAQATDGTITLAGQQVRITTPQQAMDLGIAYVSEDRRKLGLAMPLPIFANISLASLKKLLKPLGLIDRTAEAAMAETYRAGLAIKTPDIRLEVGKLSGGNQQKVMLAKWLETKPRVLIFDEPTRGIDVGAKAEVHAIIRQLAAEGVAILVISSDLPEVLALADRILVMREGRQSGILPIEEATQERVIALAAGQTTERPAA